MAKIKSHGTRVYVNGILVGALNSITPSERSATIVDVTTHEAASNSREFIGGLVDPAGIDLQGFYDYDDDGQAFIRANNGATVPCYLIFSDKSGFACDVVIQSEGESSPLDDAVAFTASLKITGAVYPVYPTMTVTGALTDGTDAVTFAAIPFFGIQDGKVSYASGGVNSITFSVDDSKWQLNDVLTNATWVSDSATLTPDEATAWTAVSPATGTPTLTGS
jgi:predicted secreted protein